MPGFNFNCPKCGKIYENVKTKMAGRKVRCTCGKVFRLGPKTPEQIRKTAERKARKQARLALQAAEARKQQRLEIPDATSKTVIASQAPIQTIADSATRIERPNPLAPILKNRTNLKPNDPPESEVHDEAQLAQPAVKEADKTFVAESIDDLEDQDVFVAAPVEDEADILIATAVDSELVAEEVDTPLMAEILDDDDDDDEAIIDAVVVEGMKGDDLAVGELVTAGHAEPDSSSVTPTVVGSQIETSFHSNTFEEDVLAQIPKAELAAEQSAYGLKSAKPKKRKFKKLPAVEREQMSGAIWTLVFSMPASLIQLMIAFSFLGTMSRGRPAFVVLLAKAVGLLSLILAAAIFISGIIAVFELKDGLRKPTAIKVTGFIAATLITTLVLMFGMSLLGMADSGTSLSAKKFGGVILYFFACGVVPLTAAITAYMRNVEL